MIRDGRLGELIGTLRKFGRIGMPTDERILSHVAAKAPDIDDVWEDGPIATAEQAPMTEHYERRLRQLIGMIPEIWAGVFFGMDITSANHGPDLA